MRDHPSSARSLRLDLLWSFGGRATAVLAGMVVHILAARLLSLDDAGVWFIIISMTALIAAVAEVGVPQIAIRRLASADVEGDHREQRRIVAASTLVSVGGALLLVLFLISPLAASITSGVLGRSVSNALWVAALLTVALTAERVGSELLRGFHDVARASVSAGAATRVIGCVVFGAAVILGGDFSANTMLVIFSLSFVPAAVWSIYAVRGHLERAPSIPWNDLRIIELLRETPSLLSIRILTLGMAQADLLIVGIVLSASEAALYGGALKLAVLIAFPLTVVNAAVVPVMNRRLAIDDSAKLESELRSSTTLGTLVAMVAALVLVIWGRFWLEVLFGGAYGPAASVLTILVVGQSVNTAIGSAGLLLIQAGHDGTVLKTAFASTTFMLIGAFSGAHLLGGEGVALAATAGLLLQNVAFLLLARKQVGVRTDVYWEPKAILGVIKEATLPRLNP